MGSEIVILRVEDTNDACTCSMVILKERRNSFYPTSLARGSRCFLGGIHDVITRRILRSVSILVFVVLMRCKVRGIHCFMGIWMCSPSLPWYVHFFVFAQKLIRNLLFILFFPSLQVCMLKLMLSWISSPPTPIKLSIKNLSSK